MRRNTSAIGLLLPSLVAVLLAAPGAQAMVVTHSTQGTLFDETFESQTLGVTPTTGNISPDGHGETWDFQPPAAGDATVRTWDNASSPPGPVAYEGDQYIRMQRVLSQGSANLVGNWTPAVSTGDLTLQFPLYVPSGQGGFAFDIVLDELTGNAAPSEGAKAFELTLRSDGPNFRVIRLNPSFEDYSDTSVAFTPDAWHVWTIVYHQNAGGPESYDLSVDASSEIGIPALKNTSTLQRFFVRAAGNGTESYLDHIQIPEPASASLLLAGGLLLLKRRKS
jgi:hypothetical protein